MFDGDVRVGGRPGIGIGDSDSPKRFPPNHVWPLRFGPVRIEERVEFVAVIVGPV